MNKIWPLSLWVLAATILVAGCGTPTATAPPSGTPPDAALAARARLSEMENIPEEEIEIVSYEETQWANACLELSEPDEVCAQVITPGWRVVLEAEGEEYVFHTDAEGQAIRREEM